MKNLAAEFEMIVKRMEAEAMPTILANAKEVFDAHPWVDSFAMYGYAPYFNDGDACEFYVRDEFSINGKRFYDPYDMKYDDEINSDPEVLAKYTATAETVGEFISSIPGELFKRVFGDDQRVTFNRDGTYTNDSYGDHD